MASLAITDIADVVTTTLASLDRNKWTDLSTDLQNFWAMGQLLKDNATEEDGNAITVNLMTTNNGQFRFVGLNEVDEYNFNDVMASGSIPWKQWNTNYVFNDIERVVNSGNLAQIVDLVKTRRAAGLMAQAEGLETAFWSKPAASTDTKTMYGVGNYIVKNATEGFNGGNPTGYTAGVAFDSTVQMRWKNYSTQFVNVNKPDLVARLRKAQKLTDFKSPLNMSEIRNQTIKRGLYTCYSVINSLESLAEAQNDKVGNDLASYDGVTTIFRLPLNYVAKLDADAQTPVYGIDWTTMKAVYQKGYNAKEQPARAVPTSHLAIAVDVDTFGNLACYNRRANFVANIA